jgi:membrane protein involved in colicin uptake
MGGLSHKCKRQKRHSVHVSTILFVFLFSLLILLSIGDLVKKLYVGFGEESLFSGLGPTIALVF